MALENNDQEYIKRLERLVDSQAELLKLQRDIIHILTIPRPMLQYEAMIKAYAEYLYELENREN